MQRRLGLLFAVGAYFAWGVSPLYWKLIQEIPSFEITLHRVIWSLVFLFIVLVPYKKVKTMFSLFLRTRERNLVVLSAALIGSNWLVYVYAVNAGHVVDASLGYFINPLLSVLFGILFFQERPTNRQALAIALAAVGVLTLIIETGRLPWIALTLSVTFALYGLLKKRMMADTLAINTGENLVLLPFALFFLFKAKATLVYAANTQTLLILSGVVTALPLLLFAESTKHLRLSTVGFLQYISPTMQFLIGIFVFREPFGLAQGVAFGLIWCGLAVYTVDLFARQREH